MRASATHSLPSLEHWPKRIPLIRTFLDEVLEPVDHALHQALFGVAFAHGQGRVEVDAMATRRDRVLASRDQGSPGLEGKRGGAPRHDRMPPEETDVHAWALLQVAEEGDDMVCPQRFGNCPDGGAPEHDHVHPESLPGFQIG